MSVLDRLLRVPPRARPRPAVRLELDGAVPAWTVRVVSGVLVTAGLLTTIEQWPVALLVGLAVALIAHPGLVGVLLLCGAAMLAHLPPELMRAAVFTGLLHVVLLSVRLTSRLPATGLVEVRLLRRTLATSFMIQLVAQGAVLLGFAAVAVMPPMPWLAALSVAALFAGSFAALRWWRRRP